MQREITDQHLKKFFDNPKAHTLREFDRTIKELEAVLSPEQISDIRESFKSKFQRKAKVEETGVVEKKEKTTTEKYLEKKPEDLQKLMNSRSGIQKLRKDAAKSEKATQIFDHYAKQKVRDIIKKGKIEGTPTGTELAEIMNIAENRELLEELLGTDAFEIALQAAKELGNEEASSAAKQAMVKKIAKKAGLVKHLGALGFFI